MKAKKEYGQNFLSDENILESIVDFAGVTSGEHVFEIGPGKGALTAALLKRGAKVTALEVDSDLIPGLIQTFGTEKNFRLVEGDILQFSLESLGSESHRVVANIPYYITAPIIRTLLTAREGNIQSLTLLVQKEVAERLAGKNNSTSVLTIMAQYYGAVTLGPIIERGYFSPVPKVDSQLVTIIPRRKYDKDFDKAFFRLVKKGFAARRKTLVNNFVAGMVCEKEVAEKMLQEEGLDIQVRPQKLSVDQWEHLFQKIESLK